MKKIVLILLCLASPTAVAGQDFSVSVAPYSFKFWGQVTGTASVSVDYTLPVKGSPVVGVHYFGMIRDNNDHIADIRTSTLGFSYMPVNFRFFKLGMIGTVNGFPTYHSSNVNFMVRIDIPIGRIAVSYSHISNGFGLQSPINHGIDFVSIAVKIR